MQTVAYCKCGRPITDYIPHCPYCGWKTVYAKSTANVWIDKDTMARGFRCRRCGWDFNDHQECEAPPVEVTTKDVKSLIKKITSLPGMDSQKLAIEAEGRRVLRAIENEKAPQTHSEAAGKDILDEDYTPHVGGTADGGPREEGEGDIPPGDGE